MDEDERRAWRDLLAFEIIATGLLVVLFVASLPPSAFSAAGAPDAPTPRPGQREEFHTEFGPCDYAQGQELVVYSLGPSPIASCVGVTGQVPFGGSLCTETWTFPVAEGAHYINAVGMPGSWIFVGGAPGNVTDFGAVVNWTSYGLGEQATGSIADFEFQELAPCFEDPELGAIAYNLSQESARISSLSTEISTVMSEVSGLNATTQARVATVRQLVSLALTEVNASYAYKLTVGTPEHIGGEFDLPVFVQLMNGTVANATISDEVCGNLSVTFINASAATPVNATTTGCGVGHLDVDVSLSSTEVNQTGSGAGILTLTSPVRSGTFTNLAAGAIAGQEFAEATAPPSWWLTFFGITTAPPVADPASVSDVVRDLAWWGSSTAGRATYALATIAAVAFYIHGASQRRQLQRDARDRQERAERRRLEEGDR
jgi:hypothetical protein